MKRLLPGLPVVLAGLVLAGCGTAPERPRVDPDLAGKPTWGGCRERSMGTIDYASDAGGARTAKAALAPFRRDGDHVVFVPRRHHTSRHWLLVDQASVIHTSVEMWHGEHGWLVDVVDTCA